MNSSSAQYKICLVSDHLAGGGAERCSALLSQFFERTNCSVHHVLVLDKIEYEYSGEILNLGKLKTGAFNINDRIHRFWVLFSFFRKNRFDFIIDTRAKNKQWQELIIAKFIYNASTIWVVHSYMTELYFPKWKFLARNLYKKAYTIVAVSNKINEKIRNNYLYTNVKTIYNPIDFNFIEKKSNEKLDLEFNFILAVGNMYTSIKQFDKLINCYALSELPQKGIKLIIIGEGDFKSKWIQLAEDLKLKDQVIFTGSCSNPFPYYKKALFTVLSSKNEGFPTVLLESLACETPVISFDCLSGPNEIIQHQFNGLLVENQNEQELTLSINEMISNKELYLHCKKNAKSSVSKFSLESIGEQWIQLFQPNK